MTNADSSSNDTRPLIMSSYPEDKRHSFAAPEVVPAENLKESAFRHDDSWYLKPQSTQIFSPTSHSPYTPTPALQSVTYDITATGRPGSSKTTRTRFAALVALATFLVTALALGIGLGIPLIHCKRNINPGSYAPLEPLKVESAKMGGFCNENGRLTRDNLFTTRDGNATFDLVCARILQEGLVALDPGSTDATSGTVKNVAAIVAYSVGDCIHACASLNAMNLNADPTSPTCQGVTFISAMKNSINLYGGNCFLKNATVANLGQAAVSTGAVSAEVHGLRN